MEKIEKEFSLKSILYNIGGDRMKEEYLVEFKHFKVRVELEERHLELLKYIAEKGKVLSNELGNYELELASLWILGLIEWSSYVEITKKGLNFLRTRLLEAYPRVS